MLNDMLSLPGHTSFVTKFRTIVYPVSFPEKV